MLFARLRRAVHPAAAGSGSACRNCADYIVYSDAYGDALGNAYRYCITYGCRTADADTHRADANVLPTHTDRRANADCFANAHADGNSDRYANADPDRYADRCPADRHADACTYVSARYTHALADRDPDARTDGHADPLARVCADFTAQG